MAATAAPPWQVRRWFNANAELTMQSLRGRIVVLHAFQMLCPGCVAHSLPQVRRVLDTFVGEPIAVVGVHAVFEHHAAMGDVSLEAFLHEYRISYPVGVDALSADGGPIPATMQAYGMRGTPTTILIDGEGYLRQHWFGAVSDLHVGRSLGALLGEMARGEVVETPPLQVQDGCSPTECEPP